MNWIRTKSSFKYAGKPVTRHTAICQTPLGEFRVYEAVGGNVFYKHPYIVMSGGLHGFNPDPDETFMQNRIKCKSLSAGIAACEAKWQQIKNLINAI